MCIVDEKRKRRHLPHEKLRDLSELVDAPDDLKITAANGQNMPYKGFIEVTFGLAAGGANPKELVVPMLVMRGRHLSQPILGFNIIEQLLKTSATEPTDVKITEQLHEVLKVAFPFLEGEKVTTFINLVTADYVVRTAKEKIIVPKHTSVQFDCKVLAQPLKEHTTLLFEPDLNPQWADGLEFCETLVKLIKGVYPYIALDVHSPTDLDIVLSGKIVVGILQQVQAVHPATVLEKPNHLPPVLVNQVEAESKQVPDTPWDPPIDLSHLSEPERMVVQEMLCEECSSFSTSDNDIGCIEKLKLRISLKDVDPVAHTYLSISKLLYKEMKKYLYNLIAQG